MRAILVSAAWLALSGALGVRSVAAQIAVAAPASACSAESAPPCAYHVEDVSIESAGGVRLAGVLTTPAGDGPFPAAVLVAGSGPHDRDGGGGMWKPFAVIAEYLARHGVATLRYDKRGIGRSTGQYAESTTADFADDAEAAVHFLQRQRAIARGRVGIIGHSEGGVIAPMVAARSGDVAFIVLLAGPGLPGDSVMLLQRAAIDRAEGRAPERDPVLELHRRMLAALRAARDSSDAAARLLAVQDAVLAALPDSERGSVHRSLDVKRALLLTPWWRYFLGYDPRPALRSVHVPVLALDGALDVQVPPNENLPEIDAALKAGGNHDYQIVELPGINHLFQSATTGSPAQYGHVGESFSPRALEVIATWLAAHGGAAGGTAAR